MSHVSIMPHREFTYTQGGVSSITRSVGQKGLPEECRVDSVFQVGQKGSK